MEQQKNYQQQSHGNGFVLGVIVGVLIALLFTTKRGREILKEITDKGIKKWSELEKTMKEMEKSQMYEDEMDDESEYIPQEKKKEIHYLAQETTTNQEEIKKVEPKIEKKEVQEVKSDKPKEEPVHEEKKTPEKTITGRRWFRGLRKRA